MDNLKNLIIYFVKEFPQSLGRTQLIKAIYLLDCEWFSIYGETYSGLRYSRMQNGPFDTMFYQAKKELEETGIISENKYEHPNGIGYWFEFNGNDFDEGLLHPVVLGMAQDIVKRLAHADLKAFLDVAYDTPPMRVMQAREAECRHFLYGEELPMEQLRKPLDPLFTLDEVEKALGKINFDSRGADDEYNEVVFAEYLQLEETRERVKVAWELETGEKL